MHCIGGPRRSQVEKACFMLRRKRVELWPSFCFNICISNDDGRDFQGLSIWSYTIGSNPEQGYLSAMGNFIRLIVPLKWWDEKYCQKFDSEILSKLLSVKKYLKYHQKFYLVDNPAGKMRREISSGKLSVKVWDVNSSSLKKFLNLDNQFPGNAVQNIVCMRNLRGLFSGRLYKE